MIEKRIASHPGIYIKDAIEAMGLTQSEFALRTGLSIKNVSTIVNGESGITFEVAKKLAAFFGNSVEGWINLQTKYDLYLDEETKQKEYDEDWEIAKIIDKQFASKFLKINIEKKNKTEVIDQLRRCFGVTQLKNLRHPDMYAFCKTSIRKDLSEKNIILRNAWISLAEIEARKIECYEFDKEMILANLYEIRMMTLEEPSVFVPRLKNLLLRAGIKLVIIPFLPGSNVSGVTKWISSENCVMVAINDCGKDADRIWFSILHELGHAIKNHKRHMTISYDKDNIEDEEEIEANEFAKNALINPDDYDQFITLHKFDLQSIEQFSRKQDVASFIVIGRLQKDGFIPWSKYQDKKIKYIVDL